MYSLRTGPRKEIRSGQCYTGNVNNECQLRVRTVRLLSLVTASAQSPVLSCLSPGRAGVTWNHWSKQRTFVKNNGPAGHSLTQWFRMPPALLKPPILDRSYKKLTVANFKQRHQVQNIHLVRIGLARVTCQLANTLNTTWSKSSSQNINVTLPYVK